MRKHKCSIFPDQCDGSCFVPDPDPDLNWPRWRWSKSKKCIVWDYPGLSKNEEKA